jgi:uncharacterized membrane protein
VSRHLTSSIALLLAAGATELVVLDGGHSIIRVVFSLGFLLLVPGWAVLQLIDLEEEPLPRIGLAVAVSLSLSMATATALIYARIWSAELGLTVLVAVVVVAVLLDLPISRAVVEGGARRFWSALSDLGRS